MKYLVFGSGGPGFSSPKEAAQVLKEVILPSLDMLLKLEAEKKILAGGWKAQANWLRAQIKESTGKNFKVRPVVLYPGWFVSPQPKGAEVWVLNPQGLSAFLEHEDRSLGQEDVQLVAYHLSRYVRALQREFRSGTTKSSHKGNG